MFMFIVSHMAKQSLEAKVAEFLSKVFAKTLSLAPPLHATSPPFPPLNLTGDASGGQP